MTVNYGKTVKDYLLRSVTLLHVHRFCPSDVQFADALVSSAVVIFQKSAPPIDHLVRFTFAGLLNEPQHEQYVTTSELECHRKWTAFPGSQSARTPTPASSPITLGELFSIKRGIATGNNKFFVLPRDRAKELGIPERFCKPILPSPRYLAATVIDTDDDGYPRIEPQLSVIDCGAAEEWIRVEYRLFWMYLQHGKEHGVHHGYLASRRLPWYSQEKREPAPFLCTYMGRPSRANGASPFRFLWNKSQAIAANVYLLLYPKGPLKRLLKEKPSLAGDVFEALTQIGCDACVKESRIYGGGLYKLEPGELARVSAERLRQFLGDALQKPQQALFK